MALRGKAALIGMSKALPAMARITADKDALAKIQSGGTENVTSAFSVLIESHADDILTILAAMAGRDAEEYAENATPGEQLRDMISLVNDKEMMGFLAVALQAARTDEESS